MQVIWKKSPTPEPGRLIRAIDGKEKSDPKIKARWIQKVGHLVVPFPESSQHRLNKHDILIITEPVIGDQKHSVALKVLLSSCNHFLFFKRKLLFFLNSCCPLVAMLLTSEGRRKGWMWILMGRIVEVVEGWTFSFFLSSSVWKISESLSQNLRKKTEAIPPDHCPFDWQPDLRDLHQRAALKGVQVSYLICICIGMHFGIQLLSNPMSNTLTPKWLWRFKFLPGK